MTGYITQQGVCRQAPLRFLKVLLLLTTMTVVSVAQAATITVTSSSDALNPGTAGACTLRGAVDAVNNESASANGCTAVGAFISGNNQPDNQDTILFDNGLSGATVTFASPIEIRKNLIIDSNQHSSTSYVTLDGNNATQLLDFTGDVLVIRNLILKDAKTGGDGAAVKADGNVSVTFGTFSGNEAGENGGAISASGSVSTEASTFNDNVAGENGGAISAGVVNVRGTTFSGNVAKGGGAIRGAPSVHVYSGIFIGNTATEQRGGAINSGDYIGVINSTFSSNHGGGLDAGGLVAISNSTFLDNEAEEKGGAIRANTLQGRYLTLVNNRAPSGAAVYVGDSADLANSLIVSDATNAQCVSGGTTIGQYNLAAHMPGGELTTDSSCSTAHAVSIGTAVAIDEIVGTVLSHGGFYNEQSPTLALPAGSPARDASDPTGETSKMLAEPSLPVSSWLDAAADQRNFSRPLVSKDRDLGAREEYFVTLSPSTLPNGTAGVAYDPTVVSMDGGAGSYIYTVTDGNLPPGLILNRGTIEGTPTTAGAYTFTITAFDLHGSMAARSYTVTIVGQDGAIATTAIPLLGPGALALLAGLLGVIGWRSR